MLQTSITLITTGGTIGSATSAESVSVSQGEQKLQMQIQQIANEQGWQLDIIPAFNKNSEDLAPQDWVDLIEQVTKIAAKGCQNIVITHGTDTMAYTATALAFCCADLSARIMLTGSFYALDNPKSDVSRNLLCALKACTEPQIAPGVYLSFCNQQGAAQIIPALDVKPMGFDKQEFEGCFGRKTGQFQSAQSTFEPAEPGQPQLKLEFPVNPADISAEGLKTASSKIFQMVCYPGMDAVQLCAGLREDSFVIVHPYHSGTAPSTESRLSLIQAIKGRPDLKFLISPLPSRYMDTPYASSLSLVEAGAHLYKDIQPHQLFVLLTLGIATGTAAAQMLNAIEPFEIKRVGEIQPSR